jgi:RNA polymerase sigma-70 factor (ECF subfamily)
MKLSTLIKRHESRICIYSKIADRDISNDIFQDTFIKVIKTLKSIHTMRREVLPWVMRISHLIIDHFEKTKKMPLERRFSIFP